MTTSRLVRVFISSTFRDLMGERDELVKKIFPELRGQQDSDGWNLVPGAWNNVPRRWNNHRNRDWRPWHGTRKEISIWAD